MAMIALGQADTHIATRQDAACKVHSSKTGNWCTRPMGHRGLHTAILGSWGTEGHLGEVWNDHEVNYTEIDYDALEGPWGMDAEGWW